MNPALLQPDTRIGGNEIKQVIRYGQEILSWRDPSACDRHHIHVLVGTAWSCYPITSET